MILGGATWVYSGNYIAYKLEDAGVLSKGSLLLGGKRDLASDYGFA